MTDMDNDELMRAQSEQDAAYGRQIRDSAYAAWAWGLGAAVMLGLVWSVAGLGAAAIALLACFATMASLVMYDKYASLTRGGLWR